MNLISRIIILLLLSSTYAVAQAEDCIAANTEGYNMLLIGNSFFRPYAEKFNTMSIEAGFENHNGTTVFRGGENGRPINFWQDSTSAENIEIKAALDQGDIEYFGMTAGLIPDNPTDGFKEWIEYALINNPDITIFLSIPSFDFPANWDQLAEDNGFDNIHELYDYFINDVIHKTIVDPLRATFPSTKIFTIPTGRATFNLYQMNLEGALLDDINITGPIESSIFTDAKGHQGNIVRETGGMIWLSSIYNVDLNSFDYNTGFNTDLRSVAVDIINNHDTDYSLCIESNKQPMVKCDSTYAVILEQDIIYGEGLGYNETSPTQNAIPLLLDVYVPDNDSDNRPVFMFIHGGGFTGGIKHKPEIVDMANYYTSRGWVFASIDYRTTEELSEIEGLSQEEVITFYEGIAPQEWIENAIEGAETVKQLQQSIAMYAAQRDAKAALRWMVANAKNYNINTDYITVGGASAGAITAIALGISNQEDFRDEISASNDPTLSTTNLNETYNVKSMVYFWGSNIKLDVFEMVYGLNRYDSNDPELFMAHGTAPDPVTPYEEALELQGIYDSLAVHSNLATILQPNGEPAGHGAWDGVLDGKGIFELSFDFLAERQELILDDCNNPIDQDGDGFTADVDCDDSDPNINPNATEILDNGIDENCDGVDETTASQPEVKCDSTYTVIVEEGIIYAEGLTHDGNSPTTEAKPLLLDVYRPDNDSENRPVYMFVHGGGFTGGSRTQEAIVEQAYYFASRGWVFISIDYRLRGDLGSIFTGIVSDEWLDAAMNIPDPSQAGQFLAIYLAQRDAKAAIRWIMANADDFNINTDYITVGGGSAGATTAIALGISNQEAFRDEISLTEDPTLATTNLDQTYKIRSIVDYWGSNVALEIHELIYGVNHFDSTDPNLFIAHGTEDPTVLYSEALELVQLYDSTGVYVDFYPLEDRGHGAWNATVDEKSLSKLSFDFLVEQQELTLDTDCNLMTSITETPTFDVEVFPNPASDIIIINATDNSNFEGTLYDLNGREIRSFNNDQLLDISSIEAGVYLLKISESDIEKTIIKKLVIQ